MKKIIQPENQVDKSEHDPGNYDCCFHQLNGYQ